uniref:Centromere protein J n=1 Tax=Fundulus heteroclitus TaxID=8078 RepID=A0A3Q2TCZ9_FUNHE
MSSPSELRCSPADFLTRWMPSSTRAGVILGPSPELAGSMRHVAAAVPDPRHPDDSFASDFAPLPASADSSCLDVGGCGEGSRPGRELSPAPHGMSEGHVGSLEEMASKARDLPLMVKLEELRRWQQHVHEQLKAQQLEELLSLQEEQQRLLGIVNVSHNSPAGSPGLPAAQRRTDAIRASADGKRTETSRGTRGLQQELQLSPTRWQERLSAHPGCEDGDSSQGRWDSSEENPEQSVDSRPFSEPDDALVQPEASSRQQEKALHDRPIKPGIGGQKKTFEELLEEQLRLEEQRLRSAQQPREPARPDAAGPPKRPFLKRGEGLSRFTSGAKAPAAQARDKKEQRPAADPRAIPRSHAAPASTLKASSHAAPLLPVQRKTAVLNKENRGRGACSPPESRAPRTRVLGNHQRQNTGPAAIRAEPEAGQVKRLPGQEKEHDAGVSVQAARNSGPDPQPNPVTREVGVSGGPGRPGRDAGKERSSGPEAAAAAEAGSGDGGGPPRDSFDSSFQEKLRRWECRRQLENMELGEFELLEQAAEELSFSSNSSFIMKVLHLDQQKRQAAIGLHQRRLSSTPIKLTSASEAQGNGGGRRAEGSGREGSPQESAASGRSETGGQGSGRKDEDDSGSEFGDVQLKGPLCFSASSNPAYDKRSYQDEDGVGDSASDGAEEEEEEEEEESNSVGSSADDSTLMEDGDRQQRRVIFDDDDTWTDANDSAASREGGSGPVSPGPQPAARGDAAPEECASRSVAVSRPAEADPAPASQLMTRLFPSLRPKPPPPAPPAASESKKPQDEPAQQVGSRQLRERLAELEIEIERFKKENAALSTLRQENEKRQEELRKERLAFERTKAEELAKFEEHKKEESRRLQKERSLFEKHAAAARAVPDRKEREQIQSLKQQLSSLQEELKRRESRWASAHSRLRLQVDSLNQENDSLRDEIRTLEKLRLSGWRTSSASAEKGAQTKDGPRASESSVPSVAKGVTFATPLDSRGSSSSPPLSCTAARSNSKESSQGGAAGMKSSLRRSAASGPSSSSPSTFSGQRMEENPRAAGKSQEKPSHQKPDHSQDCSPRMDVVPQQAGGWEANEEERPQEVITHPDGKMETVLASGDRLIVFPNGTRKEVSADGLSAKVTFFNGDTKQITADQRVIYYYAEAQTTHITYPDGMEVLHFPNNQTEKHFPDGRKEITFPDQTVKNLFPDGREESVLTDGTIIQVNPDGTKEIHFNTGQKEIHTAEYKRREYPDGTVKTVYTDGRQETRYPTGRLRVKDKDGNVVLDNRA